jgi:hypothetical protein
MNRSCAVQSCCSTGEAGFLGTVLAAVIVLAAVAAVAVGVAVVTASAPMFQ